VDGDGMHSVFHIGFWEQPWCARSFADEIDRLNAEMRPDALATYALGTHDIRRVGARYGLQHARVAAMMQLTLRGIPCIYYGDEIGMTGTAPPGPALDIDGRDDARTPMQWDGRAPAQSWLPMPASQVDTNVAQQRTEPDSLLSYYRRLIRYRKGSSVLRRGTYRRLPASDSVFAFMRELDGQWALVALNFSSAEVSVDLPDLPSGGRVDLSTLSDWPRAEVGLHPLILRPDEGVIVVAAREDRNGV
jgi:alpha-glucosidase